MEDAKKQKLIEYIEEDLKKCKMLLTFDAYYLYMKIDAYEKIIEKYRDILEKLD